MNFLDSEAISAYLDGQLSQSEARRLEDRLALDADLRAVMEDLRLSRRLLRKAPRRRAPRNFTLKPLMPRLRGPEPRAVPLLRFASVLAALLFASTFALNGLARLAPTGLAAAPVPAYGVGGGGPSTAEQPLQSFAAQAPTESLGVTATLVPKDLAAPTAVARAEAVPKQAPPAAGVAPAAQVRARAPIPALWQLALGTIAISLGCLAWFLHQRARRNFRAKGLER